MKVKVIRIDQQRELLGIEGIINDASDRLSSGGFYVKDVNIILDDHFALIVLKYEVKK